MKKILVILLSTILLFACESKEEREEIKQIMTLYNYNDYEKTVKAVDDYKIKYPNSSRLKDFEKIFEIIGNILKEYGIAGGLLLYFLWKDSRTFELFRNTMQKIADQLESMQKDQTELKKDMEEIKKFIK